MSWARGYPIWALKTTMLTLNQSCWCCHVCQCWHEFKIDFVSLLTKYLMNVFTIYLEKAGKSYCMLLRWIYEVTLWKACEIYKPKSKYNTATS